MKCPNCGESLQAQSYENTEIDVCRTCSGVWLDEGEITAIINSVEETFSAEETDRALAARGLDHREPSPIKCPKCQDQLKIVHYVYDSGVIIDRCPQKHGIWLDAGEIEKIQILQEIDRGLVNPINPHSNERHCPRDGSPLKAHHYEGEEIDLCQTCGGTWLEPDELKKIIEKKDIEFSPSDYSEIKADENQETTRAIDLGRLVCVVCTRNLKQLNFSYSSGIIVDYCPEGHGIWLDHHELERIQVFSERWQEKLPWLQEKYQKALTEAREQAARDYEQAYQEGVRKTMNKTILGRFLKKVGA
ncbi:zf-TFIIB domain-containing protein [Pseudobacteriovorax antillogorgiicola]|uniref:Zn-finger domain-containing nucleic acid-binding protein n=1 Tax=Pseudobacteriovorax antillogorgiicola TaxID=1513793 RepID=A0A1Y6BQC9_9BACT|nr:zf-TFIIB domain-containing protein [Pseudobacteriovorax antillogorgiicola]TCS53738.1 Zn-finger nucleic acid-binding protein [Pseudobacteriovorax antillogorgiicola]SMF22686.1 Zn-finger domain-containing nucleic acid-binding protein [Pseudobacteriovorax antillogorgiicola]